MWTKPCGHASSDRSSWHVPTTAYARADRAQTCAIRRPHVGTFAAEPVARGGGKSSQRLGEVERFRGTPHPATSASPSRVEAICRAVSPHPCLRPTRRHPCWTPRVFRAATDRLGRTAPNGRSRSPPRRRGTGLPPSIPAKPRRVSFHIQVKKGRGQPGALMTEHAPTRALSGLVHRGCILPVVPASLIGWNPPTSEAPTWAAAETAGDDATPHGYSRLLAFSPAIPPAELTRGDEDIAFCAVWQRSGHSIDGVVATGHYGRRNRIQPIARMSRGRV